LTDEVSELSDRPEGEGWWIASDGRWYAPELHPDLRLAEHAAEVRTTASEAPDVDAAPAADPAVSSAGEAARAAKVASERHALEQAELIAAVRRAQFAGARTTSQPPPGSRRSESQPLPKLGTKETQARRSQQPQVDHRPPWAVSAVAADAAPAAAPATPAKAAPASPAASPRVPRGEPCCGPS